MSIALRILSAVYAGPFAAKRMARDANVSVRTAENWSQRIKTPSGDNLLRMARENADLRDEMIAAMNGEAAYADLADARDVGATVCAVVASPRRPDRRTPAAAAPLGYPGAVPG